MGDLRSAFVSESMATQRLSYFAEVAEIEGYTVVARLLREVLQSTVCVAHGHLDFLQHEGDPLTDRPIGDTRLNLAAVLTGELRDAVEVYPRLAEAAGRAGLADAASWFETLCALKRAHVRRLEAALTALTDGRVDPPTDAPDVAGNRGPHGAD